MISQIYSIRFFCCACSAIHPTSCLPWFKVPSLQEGVEVTEWPFDFTSEPEHPSAIIWCCGSDFAFLLFACETFPFACLWNTYTCFLQPLPPKPVSYSCSQDSILRVAVLPSSMIERGWGMRWPLGRLLWLLYTHKTFLGHLPELPRGRKLLSSLAFFSKHWLVIYNDLELKGKTWNFFSRIICSPWSGSGKEQFLLIANSYGI